MPYVALFVSLTLAVTALTSNKCWHALLVTHDISTAMAGEDNIETPPPHNHTGGRCACLHFRYRPRPCGSLRLSAFLSEIETPLPHNHTGGQAHLPTFEAQPRPCGFCLGWMPFWARSRLLYRTTTLAARCACLHFRHRPRPCGSLRLSAFL